MTKTSKYLTSSISDENITQYLGERKLTSMQQAKGIINPDNSSSVITAVGEVPYRIFTRAVKGRLLKGQQLHYPFLDRYELRYFMRHTSMFFEVITVKTPREDVHPNAYKYVDECKVSLLYNEEAGIVVLDMCRWAGLDIPGPNYDYMVLRLEPNDAFTEMLGHAMNIAHEYVMDCYDLILKDYGMNSKIIKAERFKVRLGKVRKKTSQYRKRRQRKWRTLLRKRQEEELYMNVCDAIFHRVPLQMFNTYRLDVEAFQEKMSHLKEGDAVNYIMALFALGYLTDSKDGAVKLVSEELRNKYLHMAPDILRDVAKLR